MTDLQAHSKRHTDTDTDIDTDRQKTERNIQKWREKEDNQSNPY